MSEPFPKNQKEFNKAMALYVKGEKLFAKENFKKAKDTFKKAIDAFYQIRAYSHAQKIITKYVENALIGKEYIEAAIALYQAADIALTENNIKKALEHYKSSINFFVEESNYDRKNLEIKYKALCFYPLCEASIGKFETAIEHFKTNLNEIPKTYREKLPIIDFCTFIFNAIINKKIENLRESEKLLRNLKFQDGETKLLKNLTRIIELYINTKVESKINIDKIEAGDKFSFQISLKSPEPVVIVDYHLDYDKQRILLVNVPKIILNAPLEFIFDAKVQGKAKFGPLTLNYRMKSGVIFPFKYQSIINILPGKPKLQIDAESEIKTIEGNVFDFEFKISNKGKGEALNLTVTLEVPEVILIIAGTKEKKLYSLNAQENYIFTFPLQAIKSGTYNGIIRTSFEIPQGTTSQKFEEEKKITFEVT